MGQVVSQTWYVYGRGHDQKWLPEPILSTVAKADNVRHHMGRFKHMVYKLCIGQIEDVSKIYLYQGWRFAKAEQCEKYVKMTFKTEAIARIWDTCTEIPVDGRALGHEFYMHYAETDPKPGVRRFTLRRENYWTI